MRSVSLALVLLGVVGVSVPAHACGNWQMHDRVLKRWVSFYVENTLLSRANRKRGPHKLIQRLRVKGSAIHSLLGRHKDFHFQGNKLYRRGKAVARLEGDTIKFEYLRFRLDIEHKQRGLAGRAGGSARTSAREDGGRVYRVTLRLGQKVIAAGDAMPMCGEDPSSSTVDRERDEIRRRVVLYMAWRRFVRKR